MWILYLTSYYCFAAFLSHQGSNMNWLDVFYMLFTKNSIHVGSLGAITVTQGMLNMQMIWTGIYLFAPIVILFVISLCLKSKNDGSVDSEESYLNLIPQLDEDERRNFLETYFSNERREYIESYLKINQNILIIRDYSAGSNATTMLCMNNGKISSVNMHLAQMEISYISRLSGCSVLRILYLCRILCSIKSRIISVTTICHMTVRQLDCLIMHILCQKKMHGNL